MVFSPSQKDANAGSKILIVEDEGIIADNIASRLSKSGYEVTGIAQSSEEALAIVPVSNPDLVLMDIHIKGELDGIETTKKLRERFDIPVIYLTAHTDSKTVDRAKLTEGSGFLTKPVDHRTLATTIEMATHKHRADQEIRRQRAWMATVLGTMADGMIVIDRQRSIQFLNGPAEALTGWLNADARNMDISIVLPLLELASGMAANEVLSPPSRLGPPHPIPPGLTAGRRSGERFPIEGDIAVSIDGELVVGAVITFRDATSRQAREHETRQQHKMQAVGRLAAGVAHDFNNLLFIMLGYTEEMLRTAADSDLPALTEIKKAGDNAAKITQQLLQFSRNEPVEKRDIDFIRVIRETEELLRRLAGPSVAWNFQLDENPGAVRANEGQLKQILMNLVGNARDAMPHGGEITIEASNLDIPRGNGIDTFVALRVTDTGSGMNAQTCEHLFEPFFTTKAPGSGTGLGLSIVHSIVTDLGGSIQIDSELGRGTKVALRIPRAWGSPIIGHSAFRDEGSEPATVLLAEDHEGIRHLLREYLADAGYNVLQANNGEHAIRVAAEHPGPIDLLISDVTMPDVNGVEVAQTLAARRPGIEIVLISGYTRDLVPGMETAPAGVRFLPKPFTKGELLKNVSDLLKRGRNTLHGRFLTK
jgi:two-component system cell cycle sensor histidine kinase/response regulator CckA